MSQTPIGFRPTIWREASGKLGEELLRHYLARRGILSFNVGESRLPFDLIVPVPDGKLFPKKALIQVKTETQIKRISRKYAFVPDRESLSTMLGNIKEFGFEDYEFWLSLLWINWRGDSLRFVGCLCPTDKISSEDFRPTRKAYLLFWKIYEKSPIKFGSEKPDL